MATEAPPKQMATMHSPAIDGKPANMPPPMAQPMGGRRAPIALPDDREEFKNVKFVVLRDSLSFFERGDVVAWHEFQEGTNIRRLLSLRDPRGVAAIRIATENEATKDRVELPERGSENEISTDDKVVELVEENKTLAQRVADLESEMRERRNPPPAGHDPAQAVAMQRLVHEKDQTIEQLTRDLEASRQENVKLQQEIAKKPKQRV